MIRRGPWPARLVVLLVVGYALSPIDRIPDFSPVIGYLDELILLPVGIWLVLTLTPASVVAEAQQQADMWAAGGLSVRSTGWRRWRSWHSG